MFKSKHSKVMARIKVFKKYVKNLKNFGINWNALSQGLLVWNTKGKDQVYWIVSEISRSTSLHQNFWYQWKGPVTRSNKGFVTRKIHAWKMYTYGE
jgi:hypothetical protein